MRARAASSARRPRQRHAQEVAVATNRLGHGAALAQPIAQKALVGQPCSSCKEAVGVARRAERCTGAGASVLRRGVAACRREREDGAEKVGVAPSLGCCVALGVA